MNAIVRLLRTGDCLWDIGAHKGYITLAAATRVGGTGHVYSFEPAPPNLEFLQRHVSWNGASNVTVLPYAVSNADGTSQFGGPGSSITYRLGRGEHEVRVRSVTSLLREGLRAPTVLKIDVEGSESDVVRGAIEALPRDAMLFVACHSLEQYRTCRSLMEDAGLRVVLSGEVAGQADRTASEWRGDPDILGIGPDRVVDDEALAEFTK